MYSHRTAKPRISPEPSAGAAVRAAAAKHRLAAIGGSVQLGANGRSCYLSHSGALAAAKRRPAWVRVQLFALLAVLGELRALP
jgi:hypothetical protein